MKELGSPDFASQASGSDFVMMLTNPWLNIDASICKRYSLDSHSSELRLSIVLRFCAAHRLIRVFAVLIYLFYTAAEMLMLTSVTNVDSLAEDMNRDIACQSVEDMSVRLHPATRFDGRAKSLD